MCNCINTSMIEYEDDDQPLNVNIPYAPRQWQWEMHGKLKRFNVLVVHRGAGKSVFAMNELIRNAMSGH